ncbi:uncharacterized protein LOC121370851 [Gigantopelta aegis]|uniref:uncharacterized protein LOC121370851 n=1 Tax=Gigantopelta aegis TaxID=1735272 RepID=UPI001B88950C|nr:uncharacterized protein LOC121370851 [Gigantopelta aegis]
MNSEILEVEVYSDEMETLNEDLRPDFPEEGMPCPVPQCGEHQYKTHNAIWAHWKKFHRRTVRIFRRATCTYKHPQRPMLTRHVRRVHKNEDIGQFQTSKEENRLFRNPENNLCPRRKRVVHVDKREKARLKRVKLADDLKDVGIVPNPYVCRDESIITRTTPDGKKILIRTVKPEWMNS